MAERWAGGSHYLGNITSRRGLLIPTFSLAAGLGLSPSTTEALSAIPGIKIEIGNIKSPAHQDEDHLEEKNRAGCDPDRHEGLHPFGFQVEPPVEHFQEGGIDRGTAKPKNCHPLRIEIKMAPISAGYYISGPFL